MAFALGFAGGFADEEVETPPTPPPVTVGGGAPMYRRRWIPTQVAPRTPQPPVRVRARIRVTYRWSARVVRIAPLVKMVATGPRLGLQVKSVRVHVAERKVSTRMEVKSMRVAVDPVALSRHAWEQRELDELAVVLSVWD